MTQIHPEREPLHLDLSNWQQQYLNGWCLAVGLFGAVVAGASWEATSTPIRSLLGLLKVAGSIDLNPETRFSLAVLGAVTIGWSITLLAAIRATARLDRHTSQSIWTLIFASIGVWYVIDSLLSIATGFWLNTISNTLFTAAFFIPILSSRLFKKSSSSI